MPTVYAARYRPVERLRRGLAGSAGGSAPLRSQQVVPKPFVRPMAGFRDLSRLIAFAVGALVMRWPGSRRAKVLRDQERYARAMEASDDGFWDWIVADDSIYTSPRLLEIYGMAPGTAFAGREDL